MWFLGRMSSRLQVYKPLEHRMLSPSLAVLSWFVSVPCVSKPSLFHVCGRRHCLQVRCMRLAICVPALNSRTMQALAALAEALSSGHSAMCEVN